MNRNSKANELKKSMDHHAFIISTDRKSLYTQIKALVKQAQGIASKELDQRRIALKKLLDSEDKLYEDEFERKIKSRIDEDVKQRKEILLKIQEENVNNEREFLRTKRIQQYMNSCYEIREALRRQEMQNVKECQLQQMLEKHIEMSKQKEEEQFWLKVQEKNSEVAARRQLEEERLKKALVQQTSATLKVQIEEVEARREKRRHEKLEEKQRIDSLLEELRVEEFDRKHQGIPPKVLEYRKDLRDMMAQKELQKGKEDSEGIELRRKTMEELARLEAEQVQASMAKKKAFHKATLDYIEYVKRMRDLDRQQQQMYHDRIDDLYRMDNCTKRNIQRERENKARLAEEFYAELRKQICEQYERRLRDRAKQRECKILENRFARDDISREEILQQRRKNREELDKQIAEIKRIREEEATTLNQDLKKASNDPEFCSELAEKYIREGVDYLPPHANWKLIRDPLTPNLPKAITTKGPKQSQTDFPLSRGHSKSFGPVKFCDGRGDELKL
ncbi:uncharacterized protein LOC142221912 [Haematobia irritans]|uniref:uncharacterized protein LOC142221912 n=1 Tax=Haematobia irritans TaxID=7368 RepID=UPI003F4FC0C3